MIGTFYIIAFYVCLVFVIKLKDENAKLKREIKNRRRKND